jgi:hypothetical protein
MSIEEANALLEQLYVYDPSKIDVKLADFYDYHQNLWNFLFVLFHAECGQKILWWTDTIEEWVDDVEDMCRRARKHPDQTSETLFEMFSTTIFRGDLRDFQKELQLEEI